MKVMNITSMAFAALQDRGWPTPASNFRSPKLPWRTWPGTALSKPISEARLNWTPFVGPRDVGFKV